MLQHANSYDKIKKHRTKILYINEKKIMWEFHMLKNNNEYIIFCITRMTNRKCNFPVNFKVIRGQKYHTVCVAFYHLNHRQFLIKFKKKVWHRHNHL